MRLVLFDIDGTLISSGGAGTRSLDLAFLEVFSIADAFRDVSMAGKTDVQIVREGLRHCGLPVNQQMIQDVLGAYLSNLRREISSAGSRHVKPGIREALETLGEAANRCQIGLLTGNVEQGARFKLEAFDLNRYFPFGAFGSDDEDRNYLLPIAVERCRDISGVDVAYADCVVVGDTPRDVECAQRYGAICLAVATGPYTAGELAAAGADVVMEDLADTSAFLKVMF